MSLRLLSNFGNLVKNALWIYAFEVLDKYKILILQVLVTDIFNSILVTDNEYTVEF